MHDACAVKVPLFRSPHLGLLLPGCRKVFGLAPQLPVPELNLRNQHEADLQNMTRSSYGSSRGGSVLIHLQARCGASSQGAASSTARCTCRSHVSTPVALGLPTSAHWLRPCKPPIAAIAPATAGEEERGTGQRALQGTDTGTSMHIVSTAAASSAWRHSLMSIGGSVSIHANRPLLHSKIRQGLVQATSSTCLEHEILPSHSNDVLRPRWPRCASTQS